MRKPELAGFEIEGAEMAVRLAADPENPPLLLTHGTPNFSEFFRSVIGTVRRAGFVPRPGSV